MPMLARVNAAKIARRLRPHTILRARSEAVAAPSTCGPVGSAGRSGPRLRGSQPQPSPKLRQQGVPPSLRYRR